MAKTPSKSRRPVVQPPKILELVLLGLCLSVLALRATYTEAPTAHTTTLPGSLSDTVYSLTISGLLLGALLLWFLRQIWQGEISYRVTGIEIGLGLFVLAGVVASFTATDKRLAMTHIAMLAGPVLAALLLVQVLNSRARIRIVLLVLAALGIVSAYQCAEQFLVSNEVTIEQYEKVPELLLEPMGIEPGTFQHFLFEHRLYSRGIRGFFTTSNSAASFGLLAAFAALVLLLERLDGGDNRSGSGNRLLYVAIGAGLVVAGLMLTRSKGGVLGFLVAATFWGLWMSLRRKLAVRRKSAVIVTSLLAVILIAGIGCAAISYGLKHGRLPGGNSMLVRWQYWRASAQMCGDHPFTGVGPGNFAHNYPRYKPAAALESVADPHCFPLSILTQYGPLGLVGFCLMLFLPLLRSVLAVSKDGVNGRTTSSPRKLTLAAMGLVIAVLLMIRPMLTPTSGAGDAALLIYEVLVLHIAPAAAFLIGFLLLASPIRSGLTGKEQLDWMRIAAALGCAVVGVLLHNLIDFALFEPGVWTAFWLVIACLVATAFQRGAGNPTAWRSPPVMRPVSVILAVTVLGLYAGYVWSPVHATTRKIGQAQQAASTGRFDRAHALLAEASAADTLSAAALNLNGRLYLQEAEYAPTGQTTALERAIACFEQAVERNPANYKDYEKAAMAYSRLGKHQEAFEWYAKAAARYPGCGRLRYQMGRLAEQLDQPSQARRHYQEAVDIEDAFRAQFQIMYPKWETVVSRIGDEPYQTAKERLAELSQ